MKITVLSDLHGNLPKYDFEGVELLLICGDISPLKYQHNIPVMKEWLIDTFYNWCLGLNVIKIVFIAGNHDVVAERCNDWMHKTFYKSSDVTYLKNESYDYISQDSKVYKIFGTPYCKQFGNWAFMRDSDTLKRKFAEIPNNIDILISHDAPKIQELGCIREEGNRWFDTDAGNSELAEAIKEHKPRFSFYGHIHSGSHELQDIDGTKMANTSIVNEKYQVTYPPLILDI